MMYENELKKLINNSVNIKLENLKEFLLEKIQDEYIVIMGEVEKIMYLKINYFPNDNYEKFFNIISNNTSIILCKKTDEIKNLLQEPDNEKVLWAISLLDSKNFNLTSTSVEKFDININKMVDQVYEIVKKGFDYSNGCVNVNDINIEENDEMKVGMLTDDELEEHIHNKLKDDYVVFLGDIQFFEEYFYPPNTKFNKDFEIIGGVSNYIGIGKKIKQITDAFKIKRNHALIACICDNGNFSTIQVPKNKLIEGRNEFVYFIVENMKKKEIY